MEIGPGAGILTEKVADIVMKVYTFDVTTKLMTQKLFERNVQFMLSDGISIPVQE
jgi:16S rRNA A1518/A1519 N6-dimethyltransferase RsmA/KsgA/DIM1 with predicted DNA glycosylase/AP lyase activity